MLDAMYVVISLIILEGLLSFDNALVLAAMVKPLPEKQQKKALRYGIFGAYLMRGLSIFFVAELIAIPWLKPVGAAWLLYLMFTNLGNEDDEDETQAKVANFWMTVVSIEIADMMFSIDNIFAAAAFSTNIYAVFAGVAIGILAMRFVASLFVELIKKFPVLAKVGYVLVGYIGFTLAAEYYLGHSIDETYKFFGVVGIMALGIIYERVGFLNWLLTPVFKFLGTLMGYIAYPIDVTKDAVVGLFAALRPLGMWLALALSALALGCAYQYFFGGASLTLLGFVADGAILATVGGAAAFGTATTLAFAPRRAATS